MSGKHQEAVAAYNQVITTHPRSSSAPLAYFKRGKAFEELGQLDRARESYEAVMKNAPDSDAARLAKQSFDRLTSRKPQIARNQRSLNRRRSWCKRGQEG